MKKIIDILQKKKDSKYAEFQAKLIPTISEKTIIGVRTPELKIIAKEMAKALKEGAKNPNKSTKTDLWNIKDIECFLSELPHKYFDEMQLHAFIISELKDFESCIKYVEKFLPYIDNWATCDQLSPKVFAKNKVELLKHITKWLNSKKAYTVRFGIGMLMQHYLDDDFDKKYLDMVIKSGSSVCRVGAFNERPLQKINKKAVGAKACRVGAFNECPLQKINKKGVGAKACQARIDNLQYDKIDVNINPDIYYIEMMRAWFFATALAKQYSATVPIIKNHKLINWTHNKTIQKAKESFRVSDAHKKELQKYIIKN